MSEKVKLMVRMLIKVCREEVFASWHCPRGRSDCQLAIIIWIYKSGENNDAGGDDEESSAGREPAR